MQNRLLDHIRGAAILALGLGLIAHAIAQQPGQQGIQPTPAGLGSFNGHPLFTGGNPITAMTGGTLDDGSSDAQGGFVATAASGSITFTIPYSRTPWCDVTAYVGANPATYTITNQGITLSTITSATRYTWQCFARPGG